MSNPVLFSFVVLIGGSTWLAITYQFGELVKQMGSDKAAYVVLVYPIIALILSTIFEGYQWH